MPEEILFLSVTAIVCGCGVIVFTVLQIMRYLHARAGTKQVSGSSLTTSELERLLAATVTDAVEPLLTRVDQLEERLELTPALPPATSAEASLGRAALEDLPGQSAASPRLRTRT